MAAITPAPLISDPAARAGAVLEIDLAGIVANWRLLAGIAAPAQCAAVVKADAYGLGAAKVAPVLAAAGCTLFFVATLDEGAALRAVLPTSEIAVLNGPMPGSEADFAALGLIPVLNHPGQVAAWRACAGASGRPAMLHVDTGMARLGLSLREFAVLKQDSSWWKPIQPRRPPPRPSPVATGEGGTRVSGRVGAGTAGSAPADHDRASEPAVAWRAIISHLACADTPAYPQNVVQRARFAEIAAAIPGIPASLAASSGIFLGSAYHFDLVRPGAALYGLNPVPGTANRLRPVVRLSGKIVQIREVDSGDPVGYGAAHVMQARGRLATVAVGYADGWLRSSSPRGCGRLAGQHVPLVGRVSMDLVTFDVSAVPEACARPGDMIELIGDAYGVDDAAAASGTIGYEILTALGRRYHRVYRAAAG